MRSARFVCAGLLMLFAASGLALAQSAASLNLPIVCNEVRADGVREQTVVFPGQGKTVEFFKPRSKQAFKKQRFDSDGLLIQELTFGEHGRLVSEFKLEKSDMSKIWRFVAADGRNLVRQFSGKEMSVQVFDKDQVLSHSQIWLQDGEAYKLKEVYIGSGRSRRHVIMKDDGTSIDHVDYEISGFVGWTTIKSESGKELSEPVDIEFLQELDSKEDPTIPQPAH